MSESLSGLLEPGEQLAESVPVAAFYASKHNVFGTALQVVITSRRYVVVSQRGTFKKRLEVEASWPLTGFTERINSSEGTALGAFHYLLTLFTPDEETVSAAFRSERERDAFKMTAGRSVAVANGW